MRPFWVHPHGPEFTLMCLTTPASSVFRISARRQALNTLVVPFSGDQARRTFTHFAHTRKALPFFLDSLRAKDDKEDNVAGKGKVLRMLIFGKPGVGKVRYWWLDE
jgi:hypothetical protein